jgi:hypothetical protein
MAQDCILLYRGFCNPQRVRADDAPGPWVRPAECNSAAQQIENLRYKEFCHAHKV